MQAPVPAAATEELHAALLQAAVTLAVAVLCGVLYRRYRKPYFAWWAGAWALYVAPHRRHHQLPALGRPDLALLAPGRHRLDRARPALRRAGLLPAGAVAPLVSRAGALPAGLVLHRHLPARPVPLGRGPRRPLSQPRHPVDGLGLLPLPPPGRLGRRHHARRVVRPLGPPSPRLSVPPRPRRLESVGLLPRHPLHPGDRHRHPAAGARRCDPGPERALRPLGRSPAAPAGSRTSLVRPALAPAHPAGRARLRPLSLHARRAPAVPQRRRLCRPHRRRAARRRRPGAGPGARVGAAPGDRRLARGGDAGALPTPRCCRSSAATP